MITYLKKADVKQRYCPACLRDDVEVSHSPMVERFCHVSLGVDDNELPLVSYLLPMILCPDCGLKAAFEAVSHIDAMCDYLASRK